MFHCESIRLIDNISHYICSADKLTCDENQMKIFIYKLLLKVSSASQLQLLDSSCKPQETSFHNKVVERLSAFDKSISRVKETQFPFKCSYPKSYLVSSTTFCLVDFAITPDNASRGDTMSLIMGLYKDQSFSKPLVRDPSLN